MGRWCGFCCMPGCLRLLFGGAQSSELCNKWSQKGPLKKKSTVFFPWWVEGCACSVISGPAAVDASVILASVGSGEVWASSEAFLSLSLRLSHHVSVWLPKTAP